MQTVAFFSLACFGQPPTGRLLPLQVKTAEAWCKRCRLQFPLGIT